MKDIIIEGIKYNYDELTRDIINHNYDIIGKWDNNLNKVLWNNTIINYELVHTEAVKKKGSNYLFLEEDIDLTTIDNLTEETELDNIYTRINGITPIARSHNKNTSKTDTSTTDTSTADTNSILSYLQSFGIYL